MKARIRVTITVEGEDGTLAEKTIETGRWHRINRRDERDGAMGRIDWMFRRAVRDALEEARTSAPPPPTAPTTDTIEP